MNRVKDLYGRRFDRLVVVEFVGTDKWRSAMWLCKCDCGNMIKVKGSILGKNVHSCGCLSREMRRTRSAKAYGYAAKKGAFASYRSVAKKKGIQFELSLDVFIEMTSQNCYYCGIEPKQIRSNFNDNGHYIHNGIDRVDNTKGYILGNCVPCCKMCNYAKNKVTMEEFLIWINRVYHYQNRDDYLYQLEQLEPSRYENEILGEWVSPDDTIFAIKEGLSGYNH